MPKQPIVTDPAASPGGAYSQAIVAGDFVFLAGCTPTRPGGDMVAGSLRALVAQTFANLGAVARAGGWRVTGWFREQGEQTFANLDAVARAAGCTLAQAVRVGVYLRDMDDFAEM